MILQEVDPFDQLGVADDEAQPPSRHAVALGHAVELDADPTGARLGEEARGSPAVEDQVAVREVMDDGRSGARGVLDGVTERLGRRAHRTGVGRIVEIDGGDAVPRGAVEVGCPSVSGVERQRNDVGAGKRGARGVVGVARIREQKGGPPLGRHERCLDERRLRPRKDSDLTFGIEGDAVVGGVAAGDRGAEPRKPTERRVAVHGRPAGGFDEALDDMVGRTDLGIAAAEVDERLAAAGCGRGDAGQ